jgi:glutathione S-transferase
MNLIYANGACSLSVHIMLRELDTIIETTRVSLEDKRVLDSYNPKSYVPALVLDDGTVLTEAISILIYLSEANGGIFMPYGAVERAKCTGWLSYLSSEIHKGVGPLFHKDDLSRAYRKQVEEKLAMRLRFMDEALSESEYLMKEFTIADMYALAILRICEHVKVDLSVYHWITEYKNRLESRPLIADVIQSEADAKIETKPNPHPLHHVRNKSADSYKNIVN